MLVEVTIMLLVTLFCNNWMVKQKTIFIYLFLNVLKNLITYFIDTFIIVNIFLYNN